MNIDILEALLMRYTRNLRARLRFYEAIGDRKNVRLTRLAITKEIQREKCRQMLRLGDRIPAYRLTLKNDLFTKRELANELRKIDRENSKSIFANLGERLGHFLVDLVIRDNVPAWELEYSDHIQRCDWDSLGKLVARRGKKFTKPQRQLAEVLANGSIPLGVA